MTPEEMKERTLALAVRVVQMASQIPDTVVGRKVAGQFVAAGTSVGANYRAACGARSKAEFISKLQIAKEEADETLFWIEVMLRSCLVSGAGWPELRREADEITAILTASLKTARGSGGSA